MIKVINTETPGRIWNHRYLNRLQKSKLVLFFSSKYQGIFSEKKCNLLIQKKKNVNFLPCLPIFEDSLQSLIHSRHSINAC